MSSQRHTINGAMKWSNGHHLHLQCGDFLLSSSLSRKASTLGTGQCITSRCTPFAEQFPPESLQGNVLEVLAFRSNHQPTLYSGGPDPQVWVSWPRMLNLFLPFREINLFEEKAAKAFCLLVKAAGLRGLCGLFTKYSGQCGQDQWYRRKCIE